MKSVLKLNSKTSRNIHKFFKHHYKV